MKINKIVSLCIPTYNRSKSLKTLLESLTKEGSAIIEHGLDVNISDNCSDDGVKELVDSFKSRYRNIHYRSNKINLGFSLNYLKVVEMASTEYITLLGDDDGYCDHGMRRIIEVLEKRSGEEHAELYLLNCESVDNECGKISEDLSFEIYLKKIGLFHASFIGNTIIKKQKVLEMLSKRKEILSSAYPHLYPIFECFEYPETIKILGPVICLQQDGQRGWKSMQIVYSGIDMPKIVSEYIGKYKVSGRTRISLAWMMLKSYLKVYFKFCFGKIKLDIDNEYQCPHLAVNIKRFYKILFPRSDKVSVSYGEKN